MLRRVTRGEGESKIPKICVTLYLSAPLLNVWLMYTVLKIRLAKYVMTLAWSLPWIRVKDHSRVFTFHESLYTSRENICLNLSFFNFNKTIYLNLINLFHLNKFLVRLCVKYMFFWFKQTVLRLSAVAYDNGILF